MRVQRQLSPGEIESVRADDAAGVAVAKTALRLDVSEATVKRTRRRLGVPCRPRGPRPAADGPAPPAVAVDLPAAARALERRLVQELIGMQGRAAGAVAAEAELLSKAIANQTRALKSLRDWTATLTEDRAADDGVPPRDLGELRDELRRHLERIRAEERGSPELPGDAQPD